MSKETTEIKEGQADMPADASNADRAEVPEGKEGFGIYELGFHFAPVIPEADVAVQFSHLKSFVEKLGGSFISEEFPKMIELSYEIAQTIKAQKRLYDRAYFGAIKFDLESSKVADLEKEVKAFESVIRYILIKTVREETRSSHLVVAGEAAEKNAPKEGSKDGLRRKTMIKESPVKPAPAINEAQIDKKIEEMVA